ncbi:MAG: hypothetical protein V3V37_08735 [Candidatus Adiutricales bacterium]
MSDCGIKEVGYSADSEFPIVVGIAVQFDKKQLEEAKNNIVHGTLPLQLSRERALWLSQCLALTVQQYDVAVVELNKDVSNSQRLDQRGSPEPGQTRAGG